MTKTNKTCYCCGCYLDAIFHPRDLDYNRQPKPYAVPIEYRCKHCNALYDRSLKQIDNIRHNQYKNIYGMTIIVDLFGVNAYDTGL